MIAQFEIHPFRIDLDKMYLTALALQMTYTGPSCNALAFCMVNMKAKHIFLIGK